MGQTKFFTKPPTMLQFVFTALVLMSTLACDAQVNISDSLGITKHRSGYGSISGDETRSLVKLLLEHAQPGGLNARDLGRTLNATIQITSTGPTENQYTFYSPAWAVQEMSMSQKLENGIIQAQLLVIDFQKPTDTSKNCLLVSDFMELVPGDWQSGKYYADGMGDLRKSVGDFDFLLRTMPKINSRRQECLEKILLFFLPR